MIWSVQYQGFEIETDIVKIFRDPLLCFGVHTSTFIEIETDIVLNLKDSAVSSDEQL